MPKTQVLFFLGLFFWLALSSFKEAGAQMEGGAEPPRPPEIGELENVPKLNKVIDAETGLPFDIRLEAVREAALSYGARGGLAWRTYQIRQELERRGKFLDRVFDFRQLLIPAPSGLLIEPPVISESLNAMIIDDGGLNAAVADRYLNIVQNVRIVSAPRTWRGYLERNWGAVTPPPDILRPNDEEERGMWIDLVNEGWEQGVEQANEIFRQDLNALEADYVGMIRYRMLLAQDMVSAPYALQIDRGVTGGGSEMRVGDREVSITGIPSLKPGYDQWKPADR